MDCGAKRGGLPWHCFCSIRPVSPGRKPCERGLPVGRFNGERHRGLLMVALLLGFLLFLGGEGGSGQAESAPLRAQIRVENRRDFTRIVFPCAEPKKAAVVPDLQRSRFVVRLPGSVEGFAVPPPAEGKGLISGVEVLPGKGREVQVEIRLATPSVDWVFYRYETPPRAVLYLRGKSVSPLPHRSVSTSAKVRKKGTGESKKVERGPEARRGESARGMRGGQKKGQPAGKDEGSGGLLRASAQDIPDFVRIGPVYPPDFSEMKADERSLYFRALESLKKGDFSRAERILSGIAPKDPLSPLAETLAFVKADCSFGKAERKGGKAYLHAVQAYRDAVGSFPGSSFVPHALLRIATAYRRVRFFHEAAVQYRLFLSKYPDHPAAPEALFWQGECLFQTGKYKEAKKIFQEFVRRQPGSIHGRIASLRVGDCLYKMGDLKGARLQYGAVLSESPDLSFYPTDSLFLAGRTFVENGEFRRGRGILFKALNLDPKGKEARAMMRLIAKSYLNEDRYGEALRVNLLLWENYGRDDPHGMERVYLADLRLSQPGLKWPPLCEEAYKDPVGVYQDFLDHCKDMKLADQVTYRQALALVRGGNPARAVAGLKRIMSQREPDELRRRVSLLLSYCLNSLIKDHYGGGEYLGVIRVYRKHMDFLDSEENRDKRGLLLVAESYRKLGLLEDALGVYRRVRKADRVAGDHVLFQMGRILFEKGDRQAALRVLEPFPKAFPKSPYLPRVERLLGDLCLGAGDYSSAVRWYRLALAAGGGPDTGRVYANMGKALMAVGNEKKAIEAYKRAVSSMWPFREQVWAKGPLGESLARLATYYEDRGRMSTATQYYRKIVALSSPEGRADWALYRLGETLRKRGDLDMMRQVFEDLKKRSADSLWARLADWAAGEADFEAKDGPYLARLGQAVAPAGKK